MKKKSIWLTGRQGLIEHLFQIPGYSQGICGGMLEPAWWWGQNTGDINITSSSQQQCHVYHSDADTLYSATFLAGTRFDDYSSAYDEPEAEGDDPYDRIIVDGTKVSLTTSLLANIPH